MRGLLKLRVMPKKNQKLVHIYFSPMKFESRVEREVSSVMGRGIFDCCEVVGFQSGGSLTKETLREKVEIIRLPLWSKKFGFRALSYFEWCGRLLFRYIFERVTVFHCHGLVCLPLGFLFKVLKGSRLIYDAHEMETDKPRMSSSQKYVMRKVEKFFIGYADSILVVNSAIRRCYEELYGEKVSQKLITLLNLPQKENLNFSPGDDFALRKPLGLGGASILYLYFGLFSKGRGIELLMETFSELSSDHHIVFVGYGALQNKIQEFSEKFSNIHWRPPVSSSQMHSFCNEADVGLTIVDDKSLTYRYSTPNKFFQYLMAGLPVLISREIFLSEFVANSDCGWTVETNKEALKQIVATLGRHEIAKRSKKSKECGEVLVWENQEPLLLKAYTVSEGVGESVLANFPLSQFI